MVRKLEEKERLLQTNLATVEKELVLRQQVRFNLRLPQDRRGGGKASADSNQSHDSIVPPSIAMTLSHPGAHCRVSERQTPLCCIQDKTLT